MFSFHAGTLQETAGLRIRGGCREGVFLVPKDTKCHQDTNRSVCIFLNSRNQGLEMLALDNSNQDAENVPAFPLSAKPRVRASSICHIVPRADCGTARLFAVPFGSRAGLPPQSTSSGSERVTWDGSCRQPSCSDPLGHCCGIPPLRSLPDSKLSVTSRSITRCTSRCPYRFACGGAGPVCVEQIRVR